MARLPRWPAARPCAAAALALACCAAVVAAAGCSVEIARANAGTNVLFLNLGEVELLSSVSPDVKITPTSSALSSSWNASMGVAACLDGVATTACATSRTDTRAKMTLTFPCATGVGALKAVRVINRADCCASRIDAFSLTVTDAAGGNQTTRFSTLGSALPSYTIAVSAPPRVDSCAGVCCQGPGPCQASVSCNNGTGQCVAVNKTEGAKCVTDSGEYGTCGAAGVCVDPCASCAAATACKEAEVCSRACSAGTCLAAADKANGSACTFSAGIPSTCQAGVCVDPCASCAAAVACKEAEVCSAGTCLAAADRADGAVCAVNAAVNGTCLAGVCKRPGIAIAYTFGGTEWGRIWSTTKSDGSPAVYAGSTLPAGTYVISDVEVTASAHFRVGASTELGTLSTAGLVLGFTWDGTTFTEFTRGNAAFTLTNGANVYDSTVVNGVLLRLVLVPGAFRVQNEATGSILVPSQAPTISLVL